MEKKYAYLGLLSNPMNRTSILVASPIIQLQIIVIHKGLWGFFLGRNCRISGDGTVVKFGENYFDGSKECHCPSHDSLEAECIYV